MINLLPPKQKEQLRLEGNKKLTIVLGNMVLVSLVSLVLVLFSLKFYILGQLVLQGSTLHDVEREYQDSQIASVKEDMLKYNGIIVKMNNFYNSQVYLSDSLRAVSEIEKPKGLYFKSIRLESKEKDDINVTITGFSDTRENLQILKDNIEKVQSNQSIHKIENIYFPPEVWLKSKDIHFNFTFQIVKDEH